VAFPLNLVWKQKCPPVWMFGSKGAIREGEPQEVDLEREKGLCRMPARIGCNAGQLPVVQSDNICLHRFQSECRFRVRRTANGCSAQPNRVAEIPSRKRPT